MEFTYYMHTKELHGIFKNHASYQASWATTSTACNSYPYIICIQISNTHISACYSLSNQHANWIFLSQPKKNSIHNLFSNKCKLILAHIFQHIRTIFSLYFPATIICSRIVFLGTEENQKIGPQPTNSLIKIVFEPAPPARAIAHGH